MVVNGGIITSAALTLIVLPTIYAHVHRRRSESHAAAPDPAARNAAIAGDTLNFARCTLQQTGGRLRFNLDGFSRTRALKPGSAQYGSVTSAEFRGVLNDPFLKSRVNFYEGGVDVTSRVLRETGF